MSIYKAVPYSIIGFPAIPRHLPDNCFSCISSWQLGIYRQNSTYRSAHDKDTSRKDKAIYSRAKSISPWFLFDAQYWRHKARDMSGYCSDGLHRGENHQATLQNPHTLRAPIKHGPQLWLYLDMNYWKTKLLLQSICFHHRICWEDISWHNIWLHAYAAPTNLSC